MANRERSLIVPREHGAWGILLIPLVTGAAVGLGSGGSGWGLAPFTLAALALFWLRTPVESWIGSTPIRARTDVERRLVRKAVVLLGLASFGAVVWLLWGGRNLGLLWIGALAGGAFLAQAGLKQIWRGARTAAQMIGAAGLTSTAPAAYSAVTGHLGGTAWSLWACNVLFAINQIQFVQLRIRAAHSTNRREKLSIGRGSWLGKLS